MTSCSITPEFMPSSCLTSSSTRGAITAVEVLWSRRTFRLIAARSAVAKISAAEKGFRKVAITTGISNGAKTEVVKGISEGQQVILQ